MTNSAKLCVYCVATTLTGSEKPEHPIPAALGAVSLTVNTVCDPCNDWAGRELDQPFLRDDLLRAYRSLVDQRDPRRGGRSRRVTSPLLQGETAEGDRLMFDYALGRPVMGSRYVDLGDGRRQIRAGTRKEAERLLEKARARAAAEGKELQVESEEQDQARPEIHARVSTQPTLWRREAAKMALGIGSLAYPPDWCLSDDAVRLREWMHGRDASTADGKAPDLVPTQLPEKWVQGENDEHVIFFMRLSDGVTYVNIALFGVAYFALPVDTAANPIPSESWLLDWRQPNSRNGLTTFDQLVTDAVARRQVD